MLLVGSIALASEQSERLYSRGLVEFHANRYPEALQLFDQAVQTDPADAYALYYRGVTHGRLGENTAAARDLEAALAKKSDLAQAPLELGGALVQDGKYAEAIPWLERAQQNSDTDAQASLFLGVAQLRLGQTAAARQNLARAASKDPNLSLPAHYYQGIADYRDGNWLQAEAQFTTVTSMSPDSAMGREAMAFLSKIRDEKQDRLQRPRYSLFGAAGFQYDSNVVLAPSNDAIKLDIPQQGDGSATLEIGGEYAVWRAEHTELTLGYDFYQSLHFELDQFNLQDHRPIVRLVTQQGPVQLGIQGRYDYYFLRADSFLQEGHVTPWISVDEASAGRTEVSYRMRRRDFLKRPYSGLLDAFNHAAGVRQYVYLGAPERYLVAGYRFDREDPINARGDEFGYDGNELNAGMGWTFPLGFSAEAEYAYRFERYDSASAKEKVVGSRRHDDEQEVVAAVHKDLTAHLRLTAAYFGTFNYSNKLAFDYDRHIGSIAMEVRF
jgi:tetratricopeptide (TPR) repeat protein